MIDPLGMGSSTGVARAGAWGLGLLLSVALGLLAAGCGLFAPGKDPLAGAGPGAMNPYSGRASGALRLGLQLYNGCGVMGDGSTTGPGSLAADAGGPFTYDYPANCTSLHGVSRPATSLRPMLRASLLLSEVTMFQAARPSLIRSIVENTRATWNGS